jgi:hypothetical protein
MHVRQWQSGQSGECFCAPGQWFRDFSAGKLLWCRCVVRSAIRWAVCLVQLAAEYSADVALLPSLERFRVHDGVSDIDIKVEWASSLMPGSGPWLFDSGCTWRVYEHGDCFQFDLHSPILGKDPYRRLILDREFRRATLIMNSACSEHGGFASPASAPLSRILVLEHGHSNTLTRLSRSQAVAELFVRSFVPFHRHDFVNSALDFLEEVAGCVPCYRYSFEPDERAVERILNFRD